MQQSLADRIRHRIRELRQEIEELHDAFQLYAHRTNIRTLAEQTDRVARMKQIRDELKLLLPKTPGRPGSTVQ